MNKQNFIKNVFKIINKEFIDIIIDAKEDENNTIDLILTGADLSTLSQTKIDKFSDDIYKLQYNDKNIEIYGYCPEINKEFDDTFVHPYLSFTLKKNNYTEKEFLKYINIMEKYLIKISNIYYKYRV